MGEKKRRAAFELPKRERAPVVIRPCFDMDLDQVRLIYAHHVMTGTGSFETEAPSWEEMHSRWAAVAAKGWPFLVAASAQDGARVLGFAYARQFRDRTAYAATFENSVYVAPSHERRGVGAALLNQLLVDLQDLGAREVLAVIGDSANTGSIQLHARAGFYHVGTLSDVGYKFGKSLDVVLMQCSIRPKT
jgi:phosphinothricin acetyltransferase